MKTILLFFLLAVGVSAQTLKWTYVAPVGQFPNDHATLTHLRGDPAGTCAIGLQYQSGAQVIWLTAAGKLLNVDTIQGIGLQSPRIVSVSPTVLLARFENMSGGNVLRKYTRRGAVVSFKDTTLNNGEYVALDPIETTVSDKAGFFVVVSNPNDGDFMHLKRFTVK